MRPAHAFLALALAACGGNARPPSLASVFDGAAPGDLDAGPAARDAVPLREMPSCGGTAASLSRRQVTVVLVIDRSGSMMDPGTDGTPKWNALLATLGALLPRIEDDVQLGLEMFPNPQNPAMMTTSEAVACALHASIDVAPAYHNAATILRALHGWLPYGPTPTAAALESAGTWFRTAPDRSGDQYIILATDGAPNCNPDLPVAGCRCTSPPAMCQASNPSGASACLDDVRTLATIRASHLAGVDTYVVGLSGVEDFSDVLGRMATEGGRARSTTPPYYAAGSATELTRELTSISSSIVDCRFALQAAPPDPTLVDVRLDGASLVHDVGHVDGWDWFDDTHGAIVFYGRTCDEITAATGGSRLVAAFGCPAPVPP